MASVSARSGERSGWIERAERPVPLQLGVLRPRRRDHRGHGAVGGPPAAGVGAEPVHVARRPVLLAGSSWRRGEGDRDPAVGGEQAGRRPGSPRPARPRPDRRRRSRTPCSRRGVTGKPSATRKRRRGPGSRRPARWTRSRSSWRRRVAAVWSRGHPWMFPRTGGGPVALHPRLARRGRRAPAPGAGARAWPRRRSPAPGRRPPPPRCPARPAGTPAGRAPGWRTKTVSGSARASSTQTTAVQGGEVEGLLLAAVRERTVSSSTSPPW